MYPQMKLGNTCFRNRRIIDFIFQSVNQNSNAKNIATYNNITTTSDGHCTDFLRGREVRRPEKPAATDRIRHRRRRRRLRCRRRTLRLVAGQTKHRPESAADDVSHRKCIGYYYCNRSVAHGHDENTLSRRRGCVTYTIIIIYITIIM